MWAAEMTHNTGIVVWLSNSRIRHAISKTPAGPYEPQDIAEGVWGHEPTVARAPTGEFVMFWTATPGTTEVPCSKVECPHGHNGDTILGPECLPDTKCVYRPVLSTYMAYAHNPAGPWSPPAKVPSPSPGDTNLAPVIFDDGSLLGLGRPPNVWRSPDWRNVSAYTIERLHATIDGEDPFLYIDARDRSVLHALSHAGGWDSRGGHVWSTDGGKTWERHSDVAAYGSLIEYTDGSSDSLSRRERPHLVFGENGTPVALTNGATLTWPCTHPEVCPHDYCLTSLQLLNQHATLET